MPTTDMHRKLECARVRIGAALLEAHHLAQMYRDAMHRLEQAYMDLGVVLGSARAPGSDGDSERVDRL